MSIDKDSSGLDAALTVDRPPAIPERLWNLILVEDRLRVRRDAALGLRRGVHPETTVIDHLMKIGWSPDDLDMVASSGSYHPDDKDHYDPFEYSAPAKTAIVAASNTQSGSAPLTAASPRKIRPPLWPYGTSGFTASAMPVGDIGNLLHYERGMDAETSSAIEWQVLRALSKDPVFVQRDINNLRFLGADLPKDIIQSIRGMVTFECDCVIEDIRSRKAMGDVSVLFWIDPKDSIFDAADLFS